MPSLVVIYRLLCFTLAFTLAACAGAQPDGSAPLPLEGHDSAVSLSLTELSGDAAADARAARVLGDRSLLAVMGYALIFPGATREQADARGFHIIAGTSDNLTSEQARRFNEAAHAYAARWNAAMLSAP